MNASIRMWCGPCRSAIRVWNAWTMKVRDSRLECVDRSLDEGGLDRARLARVAGEAVAQAGVVVAGTAAGAFNHGRRGRARGGDDRDTVGSRGAVGEGVVARGVRHGVERGARGGVGGGGREGREANQLDLVVVARHVGAREGDGVGEALRAERSVSVRAAAV